MPDWFPEGNAPKIGESWERSLQKVVSVYYNARGDVGPSFFPEGSRPKASDGIERSLKKWNALLLGSGSSAPTGSGCDATLAVTSGGTMWLDCCDGRYLFTDEAGTTNPADGQPVIRGTNRFGPSDGSKDWAFTNTNSEDIGWNLNFNSKGSVEVYQRGGSTATMVSVRDFSSGLMGSSVPILYPLTQFVVLRYVDPRPRDEIMTKSSTTGGADTIVYWALDDTFRTRTPILRLRDLGTNIFVGLLLPNHNQTHIEAIRWDRGGPWLVDGWLDGVHDHQESHGVELFESGFSQMGEISSFVDSALHADVAEYIGYDRALSDSEIDQVHEYLTAKWGI